MLKAASFTRASDKCTGLFGEHGNLAHTLYSILNVNKLI